MGYLANQFKKATLTAVLATSLVAPAAYAQTGGQAGPPPAPDNGVPTQTVQGQPGTRGPTVPIKAWENDPNYVRIMTAYDRGLAARERAYQANNRGNHQIQDGNFAIQEANIEQNRINYMRSPQGMAQYGAAQTTANAQHHAAAVQLDAQLNQQMVNENMQRTQFVLNLDNQFRNLPQYRAGGVGNYQGPPPWSTDPAYLQQLQNLDQQQVGQKQIDDANTSAQLEILGANHAATSANVNAQAPNVFRQGIAGMARISAQDQIVDAQYNMQRVAIESGHEQRDAQRDMQRAQFQFSLDQRFGSMPQYKSFVTPPVTMPAGRPKAPGS